MCLILSVEVAPAVASDARTPAAQTSTHKMTHVYSFLESAIAVDGSGDEVTEPMLVVVSALVLERERQGIVKVVRCRFAFRTAHAAAPASPLKPCRSPTPDIIVVGWDGVPGNRGTVAM